MTAITQHITRARTAARAARDLCEQAPAGPLNNAVDELAQAVITLSHVIEMLERRARPGLSPEQEAENMAQERMRYQGA